mgnify:CR=1 FL=1
MKVKSLLIIFFILLLVVALASAQLPGQVSQSTGLEIVTAFRQTHKVNDDLIIHAHIYNSTNGVPVITDISCYYHLYNHQLPNNPHISTGELTQYGAGYNVTVSGTLINTTGKYATILWCNSSTIGGYMEYDFDVTTDGLPKSTEPSGLIAVFSIVPLLFAFLFLFGAFSLADEHSALRIFLFLLGNMMILLTLYFTTLSVIKFYEFPELQEAVGTTTYWLAWLLVFIVTYFIIYWVWKAFDSAHKRKIERMNY